VTVGDFIGPLITQNPVKGQYQVDNKYDSEIKVGVYSKSVAVYEL